MVGHPTDPHVFWFGHSSGGLWKTDDAGAYWTEVGAGQFKYASVGAIALHEKNPDIMYVGMGEPQMRQSVSWGDGMYKTVDGGKTWKHIGLTEARQIAKVIIHPDDPDLVYVASMGHTWGPSKEKGVFRTKDGGKTWEKVLFKSEKTGCIDMVMNPANPKELFAACGSSSARPGARRPPVPKAVSGTRPTAGTPGRRSAATRAYRRA